ncbi:MAG: sugar ABC transporter permease, partial [Pseudomonadota bacterium]|nr:sugar ABC transporter permease [Pseudomonadota bacterium]
MSTVPSAAGASRWLAGWRRTGAARGASDKYITPIVFLLPALTLFTLFVMLPMVEAGYYSFFDWNGYGDPTKGV